MSTVGFVGTGTMGRPMAEQVLAGGHRVRAYDQRPEALGPLLDAGAVAAPSAADAADGADLALLSLPGPAEVAAAVAGPGGILEASAPPPVVADLSTNAVETVMALRDRCAEAGVAFLDAPVSGGVGAARSGSLTVMVGGAADAYEQARAVLGCLGSTLFHVGPSGAGTIAKLVNNQIFLVAGLVVQEAYVTAAAMGMPPDDLHGIVSASSARSYTKLAPLLLSRTFDDVIFRLDIAAKDLQLAAASAAAAGAATPLTRAAIELYEASLAAGDGELAFHATLREVERRADVELPPLTR